MTNQMSANERDTRVGLLNSFLTTPHGKLSELDPTHKDAIELDPLFYGHLALWYFDHGEVRDHKTLFVAHLLTSEYPEFREAGWVLLQRLAPFEVARVLDHAKQVIGKTPRYLKSGVAHYLKTREKNARQFDGAALRARNDLKHLYASLRIKPGERAQAILFQDNPPDDSPLSALKRLAQAETADAQAQIILDNKIPYTTAVGAVRQVTPALLVALINSMSPQEVINNLASLKRRGAMDNQEVKALIEGKLEAGATDKRVATLKGKKAIQQAGLDEETTKVVTDLMDKRVADKVEIKRPTALFVDKSSSMTTAIQVAKEIAALIGAVISAEFRVYAFDTAAFEVKSGVKPGQRPTMTDWDKAFKFLKADGSTSIGAPLPMMLKDKFVCEQILLVTDEGENSTPFFRDAWREYAKALNTVPSVTIVAVDGSNPSFVKGLQDYGIDLTRYEFKGDYYSLVNVLPLLAAASKGDLVSQIMELELPTRAGFLAKAG